MNLTIPDELLEQNQLSSQLIKQEISLFLLEKFHFTREQATQIAGIPLFEFNQWIEKYKKEPPKNQAILLLEQSGFIGCGEADPNLSTNYKSELNKILAEKYANH